MVTEATGITVDFSKPVADDNQKLSILISSGEIPDLMILEKNNSAWEQMILNGQLAKMNELIDQYAPALYDNVDPTIFENNHYTDGNIYRIPNFVESPTYMEYAKKYNGLIATSQPVILMRQDYYEEVGSPDINTPEEFTEMLVELQALHPDKIPFYGGNGSFADNPDTMTTFFGVASYYLDGDTAKIKERDPKYKEMMLWMNDLALKGLFTKESFVDNHDMAVSKTKEGLPITYTWTIGESGKVPADNPDTTYEVMDPWDCYEQTRVGAGWFAVGISAESEHADRAIQLLEFCNSQDGYNALVNGVEGEWTGDPVNGPHFKMEDGRPVYHEEYLAAKTADWDGLEKQNGLSGNSMLIFDSAYANLPYWVTTDEKMNHYNDIFGDKVVYEPKFDFVIPAGSDEAVIQAKIKELIAEYMVKIVFAESAEAAEAEYNNLLEQCDAVGAEKLEAFYTAEYQKQG